MLINSQITIGASLLCEANETTIKSEPMFHRADFNFCYEYGGPLTREFISSLKCYGWSDGLIDSRVHMSPFPGVYLCIPGWHHDDVPREREDGQPNYINPSYKSEHAMCIWGDVAPTEFALGRAEFEIPPVGEKIYKVWSPIVHKMCEDGRLNRVSVPERQIIFFDWQSWHRGTPTIKKGFRFFIRATRKSNLKARNEIRHNANIYLPENMIEEGW